ncbi:acyl carrier protein [Actinacidiphila sp. bgisy145]|uniref:acyl carrier protein n=1 Tax=Actinacidiphila sp. bgisy145 TaxID=3413792 RepID=UPI003EB8E5D4
MTANSPDREQMRRIRYAMAQIVSVRLERSGVRGVLADALSDDMRLGRVDFAALGLNSVDWMGLASEVEDAFEIELPDAALLDGAHRSVAGWSEHVHQLIRPQTALRIEPEHGIDTDACGRKDDPCE